MLRAGTVAELFDAMRDWVEPANNLLAADVDGTIGYLFRGRVPVRPKVNGDLPVPGWTGEHEWHGWVPFDELPRCIDPASARIVTANNKPVPPEYPHFIGRDFAAPWRAGRIVERLDALPSDATVEDMRSVLGDVRSASGLLLRGPPPANSTSRSVRPARCIGPSRRGMGRSASTRPAPSRTRCCAGS